MKQKTIEEIPQGKINTVKELSELIKNKKTILIASIKDLPASQFQEISKKLRGKAIVKVPKKNLLFRAINESKNETVNQIKDHVEDSIAILFSDIDSFELASELIDNKSPAKAKAGQEAPEDIEIPAGPTDLVPGPAISELGALGIQIQIEKGKIHIKESKIIVKEGQKISSGAADLMSKLDIKPFSIGFIPLSAFDTKDNKLYLKINIDKEATLERLKSAYGKALPFAVEIGYVSSDTIKFFLRKASMHEKALSNLIKEEIVEEKETEKVVNNKEVSAENSVQQDDNNTNETKSTEEVPVEKNEEIREEEKNE